MEVQTLITEIETPSFTNRKVISSRNATTEEQIRDDRRRREYAWNSNRSTLLGEEHDAFIECRKAISAELKSNYGWCENASTIALSNKRFNIVLETIKAKVFSRITTIRKAQVIYRINQYFKH